MNAASRRARQVAGHALFALAATLFLSPFLFAVITSFRTLQNVSSDPVAPLAWIQEGISLEAWQALIGDSSTLMRAAGVSAVVALCVVAGRIVLCSMAGYALSRGRFHGRRLLLGLVIATLAVPPIVLAVPRFLVMKELGMLNTMAALIVPLLFDAFGIFLMKQTFDALPVELEEAARIDGANAAQIFLRVMLPLAASGLIVLGILSFQSTWNEFLHPLIAAPSAPELRTLPVQLSFIAGGPNDSKPWNTILLASMLTTLPLVIVFVVFQRFFVKGVAASGIKA